MTVRGVVGVVTTTADEDAGVHVRPVQRADLLAVFRIEKASFPQPWPYDAFERYLDAPAFLVAVEDGSVVGYVVGDVVRNHGRDLGHIKDLAVHPDRRGHGIGATLLGRAVPILEAEDVTSIKLEVREDNEAARSLYRSFDFQPLRRVSRYYDDGEDAVVMVRGIDD